MIKDLVRIRRSLAAMTQLPATVTLGHYLAEHGYGRLFQDTFMIPMGAAIWSADPARFMDFPACTLARFFLNHRFLEMSIRLPKQMMVFEDKIRKIIAQQVRRGRIEVSISIAGEGLVERKLSVNWSLLEQYQSMMEDIKGKFQLQDSITLEQLMAMPEVTAIEEIENVNEHFENSLYEAVRQAAHMLKTMRDGEGERLHKDIAYRLQEISNCVNAIIPHAPIVTQKYRERLENRLKEPISELLEYREELIQNS